LQNYPPGQPSKPFPDGSFVTYKPVTGIPLVFTVDPQTGEVILSAFDSKDYILLTLIVVFGLALPLVISVSATFVAASKWKQCLDEHRSIILNEEMLMMNGLIGDMDLKKREVDLQAAKEELQKKIHSAEHCTEDQVIKLKEKLEDIRRKQRALKERYLTQTPNKHKIAHCIGVTGFFNMYEALEGDADQSKDYVAEFLLLLRELIVAIGPTALPLYSASIIQVALLESTCEFKPDKCSCYSTPLPIVQAARAVVLTSWVISGLELSFHYLGLGYSAPRKITRHLFYLFFFLFLGVTLFVLCIISMWIALGVLLFTAKMLPFAAAMIGLIGVAVLGYIQQSGFRARIDQRLRHGVRKADISHQLSKVIQPEMYTMVSERRIKQALSSSGFSLPNIVLSVLVSTLLLGLLYGFLFIGFNAFSDPTDPAAGLLNSTILTALTLAIIQIGRSTDKNEIEELVDEANMGMLQQILKTLHLMYQQAKTARELQMEMMSWKPDNTHLFEDEIVGNDYNSDDDW
jgi:hypothetical protein